MNTTTTMATSFVQLVSICEALDSEEVDMADEAGDDLAAWVGRNFGLKADDETWEPLFGDGWKVVGVRVQLPTGQSIDLNVR